MKIGIDGRFLGGHSGGIESYIDGLVRNLPRVDPASSYVLFLPPTETAAPWTHIPSLTYTRLGNHRSPASKLLTKMPLIGRLMPAVTASIATIGQGFDLIHLQGGTPWITNSKLAVTQHDIIFERYPHLLPPHYVQQMRVLVPLMLRRADVVLTESQFSKGEMIRRYRLPSEKIKVVPAGLSAAFGPLHNPIQLAETRERLGTGEQFFLAVGRLEEHKNLKTLVAAYVRFRQMTDFPHRLVIVGPQGWLTNDAFATAHATGYSRDIVLTGFVTTDDLVTLYNAADLFVFPSLFEGFGLPPLEAMACGTPVLSSNAASLPEVLGDAAVFVEPMDVEAFATSMSHIVQDSELRTLLVQRGFARAALYSWENNARLVSQVYHQVING